jgi:hypothetical protein
MSSSWSALCDAAQARPLSAQLNDLYAFGGILVGWRSKASSALPQYFNRQQRV